MVSRILIAIAIAVALYGVGAATGALLYATGTIPTGATHNDCENFRSIIAEERGIDEEDVPQSAIKQLAQDCLAGHELESEGEALRTEYLIWSAWPAAICAVVFLLWPMWSRILHNQERAGEAAETPG